MRWKPALCGSMMASSPPNQCYAHALRGRYCSSRFAALCTQPGDPAVLCRATRPVAVQRVTGSSVTY